MHISAEQEQQLKLAIRDIVARNPLVSTHQLRRDLHERGFKTAAGNPLDRYYVAKVLRKLNREEALAVDQQKIQDRLAITKEQCRIITEKLWKIGRTRGPTERCMGSSFTLHSSLIPHFLLYHWNPETLR